MGNLSPPPPPPGLRELSTAKAYNKREIRMLLYKPNVAKAEVRLSLPEAQADYKSLSEVHNVNKGSHTNRSHPHILPTVFPCTDGSRKCIHDGYAITLREVLDQLRTPRSYIGVWKTVARNGQLLYYALEDKIVTIVRGVLDALICLLNEGKSIGSVTLDNIVFLANDPTFSHPLIIDCLVTGTGNDNADGSAGSSVGFNSLADMISTQFTPGYPNIMKLASPAVTSFINCLRGAGSPHLHGGDAGERHEVMLLSHPLFLSHEQHAAYVCKLSEQFRSNALNVTQLKVSDIMEVPTNVRAAKWDDLFRDPDIKHTVMHDQYHYFIARAPKVPYYDRSSVTSLVKLFRDRTTHGNDNGPTIAIEEYGSAIDMICPRLLPHLFEQYGFF